MYTEENPMEQKDFVKSIVYNAWNEFCDEDKKQPDLEIIEPILKTTGATEKSPIAFMYRRFAGGFVKGIEFMNTLNEIENTRSTPESIYRQQKFIEICCMCNSENKPKSEAELLALYTEKMTVFMPETLKNKAEIAENDLKNLIIQGFFDVFTAENDNKYIIRAAIHEQVLKELEAVTLQSMEGIKDSEDFLKINI